MDITSEHIIKNAVHFGLRTYKWNPKMKPYIAGASKGVHIFNVETIAESLKNALSFIMKAAQDGKSFLVIGTKLQVSDLIADMGKELSVHYVNHKWTPGFLTNFETIKRRIKYLKDIEEMESSGDIEKYTKKEQSKLKKEKEDLLYALSGVKNMEKLPDVVIIIDGFKEHLALREAQILGMDIVCLLNSNGDPDNIHYPIPSNVNAIRSLKYVLPLIKDSYARGRHLKPMKPKAENQEVSTHKGTEKSETPAPEKKE